MYSVPTFLCKGKEGRRQTILYSLHSCTQLGANEVDNWHASIARAMQSTRT